MPSNASKYVVVFLLIVTFTAFGVTIWWGQNRASSYPGYTSRNEVRRNAQLEAESNNNKPLSDSYSLQLIADDLTPVTIADATEIPERTVLLVHGLDDPGWTWNDMIQNLKEEGFSVSRFDYPNDDKIARSADCLADALKTMKAAGMNSIDIVAHSMGGLVSRDVLTRKSYYNGNGKGTEYLPSIDHLIMIGTPNHGSQLARFRGVSEIGEYISRAFTGDKNLFRFIEDGKGEAGKDLLPGSDFIEDLNKRSNAEFTHYTIIAGTISPVDEDTIAMWIDMFKATLPTDELPQWLQDKIDKTSGKALKPLLGSILTGVGDGCVSIDSANLEGVEDFNLVEADHIGMILNYLDTDTSAPAIQIVINRLGTD